MNRKSLLRRTTAACAAILVISAPSIGRANHAERTCARTAFGRYCVRPILEDLSWFCFTNMQNRPQCGAFAKVGAEGWGQELDFFTGNYVGFQAFVYVSQSPSPILPPVIPSFQSARKQKTRSFTGTGPVIVTRSLASPHIVGSAGGCLSIRASFYVTGETGVDSLGVAFPLVSAVHSHGITSKTYCVPQSSD